MKNSPEKIFVNARKCREIIKLTQTVYEGKLRVVFVVVHVVCIFHQWSFSRGKCSRIL
jgi:hypothetical protein